ncbi:zinc-ribbon domain-containing protein [uncultured Methylobacterium sp.]|uniref:zinc-ribbon domain-containing protein n=1 Tax=uncultured Methylobacterium sp. TaxID=157278 RepID=UPI0035CB07CB
MQIACPACASEYEIPTDRVGAEGRSVRCAACRETWFISPDDVAAAQIADAMAAMGGGAGNRSEDQDALDAWEAALADEGLEADGPAVPTPEPAETPAAERTRPSAKRSKPPRKARPGLGAFGSAAAACVGLVAVAGLALMGRSTIVRAMPQSASLYASIGLPVNLRGVDLRDLVAFQSVGEDGVGQLVIEGDLVGVAKDAVPVPAIAIEVRDARDQTVYRWSIPAPRPTISGGERARFRASLSAPPAQGRSVQVRFPEVRLAEAGQPTSGNPPSPSKTDASRGQP